MITSKLHKIRHNVPELSEWSNQDMLTLQNGVEELKSGWKIKTDDFDHYLVLGIALSWSEQTQLSPNLGFPALDLPPSQYIELGQKYRKSLTTQASSLAKKAQAWGGFWDPEDEKKEDLEGWQERDSSIAPHVWIGLKKKGFLPHINSPKEYEDASQRGLEDCCMLLLKMPSISPSLETIQRAHQKLFENISNDAGEFTTTQLFVGGYVGADPRLIAYELEDLKKQYKRGIQKAKKMGSYQDAEVIRTVAFCCARLLRIQPFKTGNKRVIAAWALCTLSRELAIPKVKNTKFWKDLHLSFKDIRQGNLDSLCHGLCKALKVEDPQHEVPSFWLTPEPVAPNQIDPKEWEKKNFKIHKIKKAQGATNPALQDLAIYI